MTKKIILLTFIFGAISANSLTLEQTQERAKKNFPLNKQIELNRQISIKKSLNYDALYYPDMSIGASAQYQSDATKFSLAIAPLNVAINKSMDKDQYKAFFKVNQLLWDGGAISAARDFDLAQESIDNQNIEVELFKLKQRVNDIYFSIISIDAKQKAFATLLKDLGEKEELAMAKIRGGVLLASSDDAIKVEILKTKQNIEELKSGKESAVKALSELCGESILASENFEIPAIEFSAEKFEKKNRAEFKYYELNKSKLEKVKAVSDTKLLPKISAFGQAAYSKPGLDMFNPDFAGYYIIGAQAQWSFFNWGQSDREKEIVETQKQALDLQANYLEMNINIGLDKELSDIDKLKEQIKYDDEIIALRSNIIKQYESSFANGVINATDLTSEMNQKTQAEINKEVHALDLIKAKLNYVTLIGK